MSSSTRVAVAIGAVCLVLGTGLGVCIGYFSRQVPSEPQPTVSTEHPPLDVAKILYNEVDRANLEANIKVLTQEPHIAGSDRDEKFLVDYVSDKWKEYGVAVQIHPYEVLLSYPNQTDSNYMFVLMENGTELLKSHPQEKILDESQNRPDVVNPFNAYSPSGDPRGDLVYVNYGRIEDFHLLERNLSIDVKGKICIARYGKIFRGDKVSHAEDMGCIGLILYSDPKEYTVKGKGVYPDKWFLPGTGAQRGTIWKGGGDPETKNYPSISTAWRAKEENIALPSIPVTPIGYDDASLYLQQMDGPVAPSDWQGDLNITYRLGPGFVGAYENSTMKMHVTTKNRKETIHNVIGYIRGEEEPDRYIIYGAHRDAWVFGSIDPSSAQTILIELGKIFGKAVKAGWKPRRTIILCSWGAEEYGLIGSTEWVEEFQKNLGTRAVVYINLDTAILGGYTFNAGGSPSLIDLVFDVTKTFPNPHPDEAEAGRTYLYDTWKRRWPANPKDSDSKPFVRQLGSGSDYTAFIQLPGVSVLDFVFAHDIRQGIEFYPVYHSVYETFDYMKTFVDPEFIYHQAMTRIVAEIGRRLVDDVVLPFDVELYAEKLVQHKDDLIKQFGSKMTQHGINFDEITSAVDDFKVAAKDLNDRIGNLTNDRDLDIRAINDQLMQLERAFIDENRVDESIWFRHVVYAPSQHNSYGRTTFPGLVDSMFDIDADAEQEKRWAEVRRQYSIIVYHIGSAASTLKDFTPMKGASNS